MSICSGCLSRGRNLKPLESIAMTKTLVWLSLDEFPAWSMLCWECEADLTRADRFRRRAQLAQFMFSKHKIKEVLSKENVMSAMISKGFALGSGELSLSTMSTVLMGEENHKHIEHNDKCNIEDEIKQEISDPIEIRKDISDPISIKEEISEPTGSYSEEEEMSDTNVKEEISEPSGNSFTEDVTLEVNSNSYDENGHQQPIITNIVTPYCTIFKANKHTYNFNSNSIWSMHQQSATIRSDIQTEFSKIFGYSCSEVSTKAIAAKSHNSTDFVPQENTAYKYMNAATTSANPTTQMNAKATVAKYHNSTDFLPEENTAYKVVNAARTSANSTTQMSTNAIVAKSEKSTNVIVAKSEKSTNAIVAKSEKNTDFVPEENTAYKVVDVTKEEMIKYRQSAKNEVAFKSCTLKCELCIKLFKTQLEYNTHDRLHWKCTGPLLCETCSCRFQNENIFKQHCADHLKVYECLKCSYRHPIMDAMHEHLKSTHSIFFCQYCFMKLDCVIEPTDHVVAAHMKTSCLKRSHKCEQCGKIFKYPYEVKKHMETHLETRENRKKACPHCHQRVIHLDRHILKLHSRNPESYCETCQKQFACVDTYKKHLETSRVHNPAGQPKEQTYCDICMESFRSVQIYKKHMRKRHTQKADQSKFECKHCLKQFQNQKNLQCHIKVVHEQKRPFKCEYDQCSFTAPSNTLLNGHIRKKHETHNNKPGKRKKDMICQYCSAGFYALETLKNHILTHTGEKLYHCEHCEWKFAYRGAFITHLRGKHPEVVSQRKKRNKDLDHK